MNRPLSNDNGRSSASVRVDGTEVRYHQAGAARNGQPPLVLVQGTTGSTDSHFGYLFPMLAFERRVISVDLARPADGAALTIEHLARQVQAVIDSAAGSEPVDLLGYSLGAVVAASVAAAQPQAVRALVLVAPWMKTDAHQRLRNRIWRELREAGAEALRPFMLFCAFSPGFIAARTEEELAAIASRITVDEFVDLQMVLNTGIDIAAQVPRIRAATLVVGCTHDQMVPVQHARGMFGAIDDARYTQIDSGHGVVFERAAELLCQVSRFLGDPAAHPAGTLIPAVQP
ncbi:alpha/beta fold hydrolase [Azohydromonas aeria]|uniref:alpha/beta fold hydrolase n=1 Tax=Azohydromonas aeria TaxID=2590212 RepID=UPI0012F90426|nr:alpha/beta hydrolase [Azohydromonas aeria]